MDVRAGHDIGFLERLFNHVLAGDLEAAIVIHASAGRDEAAQDYVLPRPRRYSTLPLMAASASTRVVLLEGGGGAERTGGE